MSGCCAFSVVTCDFHIPFFSQVRPRMKDETDCARLGFTVGFPSSGDQPRVAVRASRICSSSERDFSLALLLLQLPPSGWRLYYSFFDWSTSKYTAGAGSREESNITSDYVVGSLVNHRQLIFGSMGQDVLLLTNRRLQVSPILALLLSEIMLPVKDWREGIFASRGASMIFLS